MLENPVQYFAALASITGIGVFFGFVLSVANKKLQVRQDPRVEHVLNALPGANCGACGMPGCAAYASKIVEDGADISLCPVGGSDSAAKIAAIMGLEASSMKPRTARIHCQGGSSNTKSRFVYEGPKSCAAAQQIGGGFRVCSWGCLGFGDCAAICPFDAIRMDEENLPVVNAEKCTGCGKCLNACPRGVISLEYKDHEVTVLCRNQEKGAVMKQGCAVGCIGCKMCETKACKIVFQDNPEVESAIKVDNFIAKIDYEVCIDCGKCAEVCPQKVIYHPVLANKSEKKENADV